MTCLKTKRFITTVIGKLQPAARILGGKEVVALIVAKEWCMYETANSIHEGAVLS